MTLGKKLKADREVVLEAVKKNGMALEYAGKKLKADREVVLEAVKNDGSALEYASDELKREFVLEAVKKNGMALEYAGKKLKADREVVLEAVKNDGSVLKYASKKLKADREVVLEAVKNDGSVLKYASDELKADEELVKLFLDSDEVNNLIERYEEGEFDDFDIDVIEAVSGKNLTKYRKSSFVVLYRNEVQHNKVQYKCVVEISGGDLYRLENDEISVQDLADQSHEEFELEFDNTIGEDIKYKWELLE